MGYIMRHKKADGEVELSYNTEDEQLILDSPIQNVEHTNGVWDSTPKKKEVWYNFGGGPNPSRQKREAEIRAGLERERRENLRNNGMSKGRTRRKVASIPPELWHKSRIENPGALKDPKYLKKFCRDNDLMVVPKW